MWGSFGDIVFHAINTPSKVQSQRRWRVVPHRLLNRYPKHEHQGEDEHNLSLDISLHKEFTDPAAIHDALVASANAGRADTLMIGFDYWGEFALKGMTKILETTTLDGETIELKLQLKLVEIR